MKMPTLHLYGLLATFLILVSGAQSTPIAAGSPPKNLRVTGVTDWTVNLKWDAPKGKAPGSYVVQCSNGRTMTVPGSQTTASFSNGFDFNRTYSFRAFAVTNGSWSGASNTVTATLLPDKTPPTTPEVVSTGSGPTHIDLAWTSNDASPSMRFNIYVDGVLRHGMVAGNSRTILLLSPATSYSFQVQARDSGGNWSDLSQPIVITTPPADPNDNVAPTAPPGLWGDVIDGDREAMIFWGHSTDNVTSSDYVEYVIFLNGTFEGFMVGTFYPHEYTLYLERGALNTIQLFARDEAGNLSEPSTITIDLRSP